MTLNQTIPAVSASRAVRLLRSTALALAASLPLLAGAALPIQTWTHASGARIFLVESHTIPMVDVQLDFDAGSRRDPADKAGLAAATAAMADKGLAASAGEPALDENAISEAWSDLGAMFGGNADLDRTSYRLRSLNYPDLLGKAAALASRQLAQPAFPAAIWQRDRDRLAAALREAATRPGTAAGKAYAAAVYGNHPYGYQTTEASLARIAVQDMARFHAATILPCRARVSVVGAVTRAQAETLVGTLLSRLPHPPAAGCPALPAVPEVAPLSAPAARDIPFDSAQAHVLIGQPGYRRNDPDFFALLVGEYILGGSGLVSRLSDEVREKRGLAYSVDAGFAPGRHAGAFTVSLQTRPDQAPQAIALVREILAKYVAEGPTEAEMKAARDYLVNSFALRLDSNRKLLGNVANIAWNDLPLDYLAHWTDRVSAVTREDVRAAVARKLQPQNMVTVVVGAQAGK